MNHGLKRLWIILAICWGSFYLFVLSAKLYEVSNFEDFWVISKHHAPISIIVSDPVDPNVEFAYYADGKKQISLKIPSSSFIGTTFHKTVSNIKSGESFKGIPQETVFDIADSLANQETKEELYTLYNKAQPTMSDPTFRESLGLILFGALPPILLYGLLFLINWIILGFKSKKA